MKLGKSPRRGAWASSIAALAALCALAPGSALGAVAPPSDGVLSPRLAELAQPAVRSAPPEEQAQALSLDAEGPGSLVRDGNRVLVEVRFDQGAAAGVEDLRQTGAEVVNVSQRYQTVTVAARPDELRALNGVSRVAGVREVLEPIAYATCPSGSVVSEGDSQLQASTARSNFAIDGSGVTVGILSDSFDQATEATVGGPIATHAAQDVASGDLPGAGNPCGQTTPVNVLENDLPEPEKEDPADEGRGMAQIVHDLAPGSSLAFASAFNGELAFVNSIERLARPASEGGAGAKVIADDVAYFEEPFFQDGPVADAVDNVAAHGVSYFSAAGNDNLFDAGGHEIASWEAPSFRNSGGCPPTIITLSEEFEVEERRFFEEERIRATPQGLHPEHCMDFNPSGEVDRTFEITVEKGATLIADLQWAEPWQGVNTDIDAFLLNSFEEVIGGSVEDNVFETERPFELVEWENETGTVQHVNLVINRFSGGSPRLKFALLENGGGVSEIEYPTSREGDVVGPTVFGHAAASGAVGVGAIRYNTTSIPERFSSRGPTTHYFGPVNGTSPAPTLSSPQTIQKPDVVASDCGATTFFAQQVSGAWRFCGTSAAAPHAAAVAALMLQSNPSLSPAQVRSALVSTALPVGSFGPDAVGAGMVDARSAVASVALPPTVSITSTPPRVSRNRQPSISFTANRPVTYVCSLNGTAQSCASPFTPEPLADGTYSFVVSATDLAGRVGTSETAAFTVDTRPPRTFFRHHPRKLIKTHRRKARATFRFGSNEKEVTFLCKVDRQRFRACKAKLRKRFAFGKHTVKVRAVDAAGNADPTPAVYSFTVKRLRRGA